MRGTDLRPGMVVAWGSGLYLGQQGVQKAVVLGDQFGAGGVYLHCWDHVRERYRASTTSAYERRNGGYPCARYRSDAKDWVFTLLTGREIIGEWEDHEAARELVREAEAEEAVKLAAANDLRQAWADSHAEQLRRLGLEVVEHGFRPQCYAGPGLTIDGRDQFVRLSAGALAHLLSLARDGMAHRV